MSIGHMLEYREGATPSLHLYRSLELLTMYPWLPAALESFAVSRKRPVSKHSNHGTLTEREHEKILTDALRKVLTQQASPQSAIQSAEDEIRQRLAASAE
ncbi:MAG: hypothetical protein GY801_05235 [bacterium]|nr:hypothetical protein [bacterium]